MLLNYDVNTARKKLVYHSNTEGQLIPLIPLLEATATPAFETHCSFSSNFFFPEGGGIISLCFVTLNCSVQFIFTDVSMELWNTWYYLYQADSDDKETSYSGYYGWLLTVHV